MSDIINKAALEQQIDRLNDMTGQPMEPYNYDAKNCYVSQPGNYHLDWAYGGVCVEQMCEGGGVRTIIAGYETKRITYEKLCTYIDGIADAQRKAKDQKRDLLVEVHARKVGAIGIYYAMTIPYPSALSDRDILANMRDNFEPHMSRSFEEAVAEARIISG